MNKNEDIKTNLKQPILKNIENKQVSWYEHITRLDQNRMIKKNSEVELKKIEGKRRPKKTWMEQILFYFIQF